MLVAEVLSCELVPVWSTHLSSSTVPQSVRSGPVNSFLRLEGMCTLVLRPLQSISSLGIGHGRMMKAGTRKVPHDEARHGK